MPQVEFQNSPSANKDARKALNLDAIFLAELPDGSIVLGDRGQNCFIVLDDMPLRAELPALRNLLASARMASESRYLGEPDTRTLGRDLRSGRQLSTPSIRRSAQAVEIDL